LKNTHTYTNTAVGGARKPQSQFVEDER